MEQQSKKCRINYETVMSCGKIAWVDVYVNGSLVLRKLKGRDAEEIRQVCMTAKRNGDCDVGFSYAEV